MKIPGMPLNARRDRDEDLLLFMELHKRDKDRFASLLQPVSDEFEPNGNYALYRIASGKKGFGSEFSGENDKNDYDWLRTPPATPLFPSLEMEANAPELAIQRELPLLPPLSRFVDKSVGLKKGSTTATTRPKSPPNSKGLRSATQSQRPTSSSSSSSTAANNTKETPTPATLNQKTKHTGVITGSTPKAIPTNNQKETSKISNNSTNNIGLGAPDSKPKPRSRGVSPLVRCTIPAGFSNDTPPNLRTDRAISATRGRPVGNPSPHQKHDHPPPPAKPRRQSCSPSVTRGRKESSEGNLTTRKGNGRTHQIFGSRMVDKVMNARRLISAEEREPLKARQQRMHTTTATATATTNNGISTTGFGRMMSKSSLDFALKHKETRRDAMSSRDGCFPKI